MHGLREGLCKDIVPVCDRREESCKDIAPVCGLRGGRAGISRPCAGCESFWDTAPVYELGRMARAACQAATIRAFKFHDREDSHDLFK